MDKNEFANEIEKAKNQAKSLKHDFQKGNEDHQAINPETVQTMLDTLEELHVAEEELRQSNNELSETRNSLEAERYRYQQLFNFAPGGYLVSDAKGVIRDANQAASALLGISLGELIGKPLGIFVQEEVRSQFRQHLNHFKKIDRTAPLETTLVSTRKEHIPVSLVVAATKGSEGQITSLRWFLHDISELKQVEEELQRSQAEWETTFNAMSDWISLVDVENRQIIRSNRAGEALFDIPMEEIIGQTCCKLVHGVDEPVPGCPVTKVFESRQRESAEFAFPETGQYLQVIIDPIINPAGEIMRMVHIVRDVDARVQAEQALSHSHDLMRYIIEHNRSAIAVHDRDLNFIYVSQQYLQENNLKKDNIIGRYLYDVSPDLPQKWRDVHQKALVGEISSAEDDPYIHEDGTVDWTRWECRPWYEADGSIGGIIVYTEVITERKQAELKIQASEEKLRSALESAVADSWEMDLRTRGLTFGDNWAQHLGYEPGEVPQTIESIDAITHPEDVLKNSERYKAYLSGEADFLETECRIMHKNGDWAWIMTRGKIVEWENGVPVRLTGTNVDITERIRAEQAKTHSHRLVLAISQATEVIQRARTPQAVYKAIGEQVGKLGLNATIFTLSEDRTHLILSYHTITSNLVQKVQKLTGLSEKGYRFPLEMGSFYQKTIDTGVTIFSYEDHAPLVEVFPSMTRPVARKLLNLFTHQQSIIAPMIIKGKLWGLLSVIGTTLIESDKPAITAFANQAAIAIENTQLYQTVVQDANELEKRVQERTREYQNIINLTADREIRMIGLKEVVEKLRAQLINAGLKPVAGDPLQAGILPDKKTDGTV